MAKIVLVMRGSNVLARADGTTPNLDEVSEFMTLIEHYDHNGVRVVTSSTGSPPEDWKWSSVTELQAGDPRNADAIGEAVLCGS